MKLLPKIYTMWSQFIKLFCLSCWVSFHIQLFRNLCLALRTYMLDILQIRTRRNCWGFTRSTQWRFFIVCIMPLGNKIFWISKLDFFPITQDRSSLLLLFITILKINATEVNRVTWWPGITRSRIFLRLSFYWQQRENLHLFLVKRNHQHLN